MVENFFEEREVSKEKLIELIKLDDYDLKEWLYNVGVDEARETFIQAMKDVEQETKNGCADVMPPIKCRNGYPSPWPTEFNKAHRGKG